MRLILAGTLMVLAAQSAPARPRIPSGVGSAIGLRYSIQHDVLRPGEDTDILLCLTNENPRSGREVAPGDSFAFTLADGVVRGCGDLSVFSPDGSLSAADFACEIDSNVVRLVFTRDRPTKWPFADAACVMVAYTGGAASSTVTTSLDSAIQGAFLAPVPPAILLSIAPGLGSIGAPGPEGPSGPAGDSGVGAWRFATSTGMACGFQNDPPEIIPGMDVTIDVRAGSSVEVHADGVTADDGVSGGGTNQFFSDTTLVLELDGVIVASRHVGPYNNCSGCPEDGGFIAIHWASGSLTAGSHRIRLLVGALRPTHGGRHDLVGCIGSADNDGNQARLLVKELPMRP